MLDLYFEERPSEGVGWIIGGAQGRDGEPKDRPHDRPKAVSRIASAARFDLFQDIEEFGRENFGNRAIANGRGEVFEKPTILADRYFCRVVGLEVCDILVSDGAEGVG